MMVRGTIGAMERGGSGSHKRTGGEANTDTIGGGGDAGGKINRTPRQRE